MSTAVKFKPRSSAHPTRVHPRPANAERHLSRQRCGLGDGCGRLRRLASGWRAELIGSTVHRIVASRAAVAFNGSGRLVLVDLR